MRGTLVLVEHPATLPALRAAAPRSAKYVALTPEAADALADAGLAFAVLEGEYFDYRELTRKLLPVRGQAVRALARLDQLVKQLDERWSARGFDLFSHCRFHAEVPLLGWATKLLQLRPLVQAERPEEVIAADFGPVRADQCRFMDDGSLYNAAAAQLAPGNYRLRLVPHPVVRQGTPFRMSPPTAPRRTLRTLRRWLIVWLATLGAPRRGCVLTVDCDELRWREAALARLGWRQTTFPAVEFHRTVPPLSTPYPMLPALQAAATGDAALRQLLTVAGHDGSGVVLPAMLQLTARAETMLRQFDWLEDYVSRRDWDAAIFQTHSMWHAQDHLLPLVLRRHRIPYACWMHGGFGANETESGYGSCDFLLGDHFLVYGEGVKKTFVACHGLPEEKIHVTGSPRLEAQYPTVPVPVNDPPRVVYVLGTYAQPLNDIHTVEAQRHFRFGYREALAATLPVLAEFQHQCEIVIRPYHGKESDQVAAVRRAAEQCGLVRWQLITKAEAGMPRLLNGAAVVILNWVSTVFFEAALTSAQIVLFNDSDLTPEALPLVAARARHYREVPEFCAGLRACLRAGHEPPPDPSFIRAFLDSDHRPQRAARIASALEALR